MPFPFAWAGCRAFAPSGWLLWSATRCRCPVGAKEQEMAAVASIVARADELADAHLRHEPFEASFMGVGGHDDAVPDLSAQARQAWRDQLVGVLIRCEQLEADAADGDSRVLLGAVRDHATRA